MGCWLKLWGWGLRSNTPHGTTAGLTAEIGWIDVGTVEEEVECIRGRRLRRRPIEAATTLRDKTANPAAATLRKPGRAQACISRRASAVDGIV